MAIQNVLPADLPDLISRSAGGLLPLNLSLLGCSGSRSGVDEVIRTGADFGSGPSETVFTIRRVLSPDPPEPLPQKFLDTLLHEVEAQFKMFWGGFAAPIDIEGRVVPDDRQLPEAGK